VLDSLLLLSANCNAYSIVSMVQVLSFVLLITVPFISSIYNMSLILFCLDFSSLFRGRFVPLDFIV